MAHDKLKTKAAELAKQQLVEAHERLIDCIQMIKNQHLPDSTNKFVEDIEIKLREAHEKMRAAIDWVDALAEE